MPASQLKDSQPDQPRGRVAPSLAARITALVRTRELQPGAHLSEQNLADHLGVSRSPVREALEMLAARGIVKREPNRGYYLAKRPAKSALHDSAARADPGDALYLKLANDRLDGKLPTVISELDVMRDYQVGRTLAQKTLARMGSHGLLERRPARGWAFPAIVTSYQAYEQGFSFRAVLEPAGLLEPTFRVVPREWARLRDTQLRMADATVRKYSPLDLFAMGAEFHETVAAWSGNHFFFDAIARQNQLRRIFEYRAKVDIERVHAQSLEHLKLLDLLDSGDRATAALLLRTHIETARNAKLRLFAKEKAACEKG